MIIHLPTKLELTPQRAISYLGNQILQETKERLQFQCIVIGIKPYFI